MNHYFSSIKPISYATLVFLVLIFSSCEKKYKFKWDAPNEITVNNKLSFSIAEENNQPVDSIIYFLDSKRINQTSNVNISNERLGKHILVAEVYYDSQSKKIIKTITFLADKSPLVYDFKVINTYPHDSKAYTQGLEYHDGFLYESTGQYGESSLRKVELKTGKVLEKIDLPSKYFAEGMTILNNKIYQLTWREDIGFVYNLSDFKQLNTFSYKKSKEGWGLTNDSKKLIKTDGTEKVWFLNPENQEEISFIEAYSDQQSVKDLNELEFIEGKIYANVYQKNIILILNPVNGAIEGIADLNNLEKDVRKTQNLVEHDEVLNGIAYDKINKRIFVTGKNWGKLFEIQLIERK